MRQEKYEMTEEEEKEVKRVCGEDYDEYDVPSYIRNRSKEKEKTEERLGEIIEPEKEKE